MWHPLIFYCLGGPSKICKNPKSWQYLLNKSQFLSHLGQALSSQGPWTSIYKCWLAWCLCLHRCLILLSSTSSSSDVISIYRPGLLSNGEGKDILDTCLGALYSDLQTKGIFWLVANGNILCIQSTYFQLVGLRFPRLVGNSFLLISLVAEACEMTKPVAGHALEFFGWALEALKMSRVTTLGASIFVLVYKFGSKFEGSFVCWWCISLIWAACRLPATCLMCLAVAFKLSIFFTSWHTLLAGNLSRSTLPSFIVLDTKSSSLINKQKMLWCNILAVSGGNLARLTWVCTALYHLSMLLLPCWKLVSKSKWALTSLDCGLQNSSNLSNIVSKFKSSLGKLNDTYWSIPNSPL